MGIFPAFRRFRRLGPLALLLVLALRPAGFLLSELRSHRHPESPVESVRIEAPGSRAEACEHHPAGCPKGCFCPKFPIEEKGPEPDLAQDGMHQPSLAHCTHRDGSEGFPAGPAFQAPEWLLSVPAGQVERLLRVPPTSPLPQAADSPLKVPIA